MYEFDPMKKCVLCGCLTLLMLTYTGPLCKRCLKRMHQEYHLAGDFHYDFSLDVNSRSPIEATVTGTVNMPDQFFYLK
jgi:hypothetical protein